MSFYIITDTHFGHYKLTEYNARPQQFTEKILNNLSTFKFSSSDVLIHLGDFCIGNDEMWTNAFMTIVPCKKWLILGNHDRKSISWYLSHGWDFVGESFEMKYGGFNILFSHVPRRNSDYPSIDFNIHGHLHNNVHRAEEESFIHPDFNVLLAIENTNYNPIVTGKQ